LLCVKNVKAPCRSSPAVTRFAFSCEQRDAFPTQKTTSTARQLQRPAQRATGSNASAASQIASGSGLCTSASSLRRSYDSLAAVDESGETTKTFGTLLQKIVARPQQGRIVLGTSA
jgi:hypothetical protein